MHFLVTGATGFVGQHVIRRLLSHGYRVTATSASENKAKNCDWFHRVEYKPYDLSSNAPKDLYAYFSCPDRVIHLAWQGLPDFMNPNHYEVYLHQQYAFLKNLIIHGAQHICVTGTCLEYGMKDGCLEESMHPEPISAYGLAKDTLRRFLEYLQQEKPFTLQWVRLFYMHGEGQHPKAIIPQLQAAINRGDGVFNMSKGDQLRDYLPIEEVASNICRITSQRDVEGIINCCSGKPIRIMQFVEDYLQAHAATIKLNPGFYPYPTYEPFAFWGSNVKLKSILHHDL